MRTLPRAARLLALLALAAPIAACASDRSTTSDAGIATAVTQNGTVTVLSATHRDVSPPLSTLSSVDNDANEHEADAEAKAEPDAEQARDEGSDSPSAPEKNDGSGVQKNSRKKRIPRPAGSATDPAAQTKRIGPLRTVKADGSISTTSPAAAVSASSPTVGTSFDSIGNGYNGFSVNSLPPDTNSAVGPNHIFTVVNGGLTVQSKTGTRLYGPVTVRSLFSGFSGPCSTTDDGDAVVRYDRLADRWVVTQFSISQTPFYECTAVSTSGDPLGTWNRYAFPFNNFPDYPKLSVWPDAYYITYNMFNASGTAWLYSTVCAMDRAAMLTGAAATQQCFNTSSSYGGLLAADLDGATPPPSGSYNPIVALGVSTNDLAVWRMKPDFATPANSKFLGPTALTISPYAMACGGGGCIKQSGSSMQLDGLGDRLMYRYAYRNFGTYQAAVVAHSVDLSSSVHGSATTGIRWYELRFDASTVASVYQQGTYTPDATYRWMPSIAMDKVGNIAVGYSTSSSTQYPSIAVTGRLADDALGTMTQGETIVHAGTGSQNGTYNRWGDYASMNVDPSDDCTFWFTTEYLKSTGSWNWSTRASSFTLPGCVTPITDSFTMAASPTSGSLDPTGSVQTTIDTTTTLGSGQTIALSTSGLPTGATASFSSNSISTGSSSTLTINTTSSTPGGTYNIMVIGTGPQSSSSTNYTLTVNSFGVSLSPTSGSATQGGATISTTVSLSKTGTAQSVSLSATGVPSGVTATFGSATVNSGSSTTLTFAASGTATPGSYTVSVKGIGTTVTKSANFTLTVKAPVINSILNPGFEASSSALTSWITSGAATGVSTTARTGLYSARAGNTTATSGDSKISQTATAPTGATKLTFWYRTFCRGTVSKDWAIVSLLDVASNKTTTVLAKTCLTDSGWRQVSVSITAGRKYTLTLTNRDDNSLTTPTYTVFDDVVFS